MIATLMETAVDRKIDAIREEIFQTRRRLRWTQTDMATRAGVSFETVSNIERNRRGPSLASVIAIAYAAARNGDSALLELLGAPEPMS